MPSPRPVRPLILVPIDPASDQIGGIQSFIRGFVKWAPDDFDPEFVGVSADPERRPLGRWLTVAVEGRPVRYFAIGRIRDLDRRNRIPLALTYTLALLRRDAAIGTRGRILQFHRAGVPLAFLRDRQPKIQVVHLNVGDIYGQRGESRWRAVPGLYHRVEDLTLPRMDRVFVVNEAGVAFYRSRHPRLADRFEFLPTWVDETIFFSRPEDERSSLRAELAAALGLPAGARIVLFVGRLEQQKDPELAVDAFAVTLGAVPDACLLVVGAGTLRQETERKVAASVHADRIRFLGSRPRPEVARLMNSADALLLSSRFEGMPITVIEALACGLPVVATNVGEVPRLVLDGVTGRLAADRSAAALADGLAWVLARPPGALAEACVAAAARYHAAPTLAPFYEAHYRLAARAGTG